jgi:predicted phosphodiesterase
VDGRVADLEEFAASEPPAPGRRRSGTATPPWTPGLTLDGNGGHLVTGAVPDEHPDWDAIFRHWNLDPAAWEIVGDSLRVNAWEGPTADGTAIFRQFKADVRRRTQRIAVDELLAEVCRWKPRSAPPRAGEATWVVVCADWQVGGHGGTPAFLDRFRATLDGLATQARRVTRQGVGRVLVIFAGDMVEGTGGNYSAQPFEADLTLRDQIRTVAQCEAAVLRTLGPRFDEVTAVAVAGNHGRGGKKVTTTPEDNADLLAFDMVAAAIGDDRVRFIAPEDRLVALVDASGTQVLVAHGDQVNGNADRVRSWWQRIAFTRWGDADCGDVLVTGHRHHLRIEELAAGRWLMVAPTLGGESRWFGDIGGGTSDPGTLTFCTADGAWWGLEVIRP